LKDRTNSDCAVFLKHLDQQEKSESIIVSIKEKLLIVLKEDSDRDRFLDFFSSAVKALKKWKAYQDILSLCESLLQQIASQNQAFTREYFVILNEMGETEFFLGDLNTAEKIFRKALKGRQKIVSCTVEELSESLNNLAVVLKSQARYETAKRYYIKALNLRKSIKEKDPLLYSQAIVNLALLYRITGAYEKAEPLFLEALEIRQRLLPPAHSLTTLVENNLGVVYLYMGYFKKSEEYFYRILERRLQESNPISPEFAQIHNNLGGLYLKLEQYRDAEKFFRIAHEVCVKAFGERHHFSIQTSLNLSKCLISLGNTSDAIDHLLSLTKLCEDTLPSNHLLSLTAKADLGQTLSYSGSFSKAEEVLIDALENSEKTFGIYHPLPCEITMHLAVLYTLSQKQKKAFSFFVEGCRRQSEIIARIAKAFPEQYVLHFMKTLQKYHSIFLSFILEYYSDDERAIEKAYEVTLQRKSIAYESAVKQQQLLSENTRPDIKPVLRKLKELQMELAQRITGDWEKKESPEKIRARIISLEQQCERLEKTLSDLLPKQERATSIQKITRSLLEKNLKNEEILVDFLRIKKYLFSKGGAVEERDIYIAFILSREANLRLVHIGEAEMIDSMVEQLRNVIQFGTPSRGADEDEDSFSETIVRHTLKRSYRKIFAPIVQACFSERSSQTKPKWVISPDSHLNKLPFEALMQPNNEFLIESSYVRYIASARELVTKSARSKSVEKAVLFANPAFSIDFSSNKKCHPEKNPYFRSLRNALDEFEPLPDTEKEAKAIAALLTDREISAETNLGVAATKKRFSELKCPEILHIASHGFFLNDPDNKGRTDSLPLSFRSGIALSGINNLLKGNALGEEFKNPILTSQDIFGLRLGGTEIVTLSACETGLGMIENNEGVMGLRRAFLTAGAKTLVVSLWKVPDFYTKELMVCFYRHLLLGMGKSEALREAQLSLIRDFKKRNLFAIPWVWAGFVCIGQDNPILNKQSFSIKDERGFLNT